MIFSRNNLNGILIRTPLADCSRGLHCWSSHIVPGWLELVLMHAETYEDLPQAYEPDSVTCLFEVYKAVEQIALVL